MKREEKKPVTEIEIYVENREERSVKLTSLEAQGRMQLDRRQNMILLVR